MEVIKKLGDRVEREHDQYLRDSQRLEDRSATSNGATTPHVGGGVDFETLVAGGAATVKADTTIDSSPKGWDDDVWGSIFNDNEVRLQHLARIHRVLTVNKPVSSPIAPATIPPPQQQTISLPSSPMAATSSSHYSRPSPSTRSIRGLGATPISSTSFNSTAFSPPLQARPSLSTPARSSLSNSTRLVPQTSQRPPAMQAQPIQPQAPSAPNYNIALPPAPMMSTAPMASMAPMAPSIPNASMAPMASSMPAAAPPLFAANMGGILAPSKPTQPSWPTNGAGKQLSKADWGDFDPLA
ncbi:hypothetical protein EIP86_008070 [Pleurotus ostreatoroseus]|nr:hypothetical protein EIP86_008070 [Pleurotus ostreatoroseus]